MIQALIVAHFSLNSSPSINDLTTRLDNIPLSWQYAVARNHIAIIVGIFLNVGNSIDVNQSLSPYAI